MPQRQRTRSWRQGWGARRAGQSGAAQAPADLGGGVGAWADWHRAIVPRLQVIDHSPNQAALLMEDVNFKMWKMEAIAVSMLISIVLAIPHLVKMDHVMSILMTMMATELMIILMLIMTMMDY